MSWYGADSSDPFGKSFFSRSPLRSGYFLVATLLFLTAVLGSLSFLWAYRSRLPPQVMSLLFIAVFVRAWHSFTSALMRHASLRHLYFSGGMADCGSDHTADASLGVAARAILDDLFNTSVTLLVFLFVASLLLQRLR